MNGQFGLGLPASCSSTKRRSRPKQNLPEGDDVNNNNGSSSNITSATGDYRPIRVPTYSMQLRSSSSRTTVGSSDESRELSNSISNLANGDGTSSQRPVDTRKRGRPAPRVYGGNEEAAFPKKRVMVVAPAGTEKKVKPVYMIDWDAIDGPPELFDENGDRQSLVSSGGKRPKKKQLPPPTYLWNISSMRKVETENSVMNKTTLDFHMYKRLYRRLDEKDLKNFDPTGECLICSNENCLLVIPHCPCRMPCCHSCMFSHLEASYTRGQNFLCPFCQQAPDTLYYNIKSITDFRIWIVPKFKPYTTLYRLIRAIGLFVFENSEVCGEVNPLCRITYASFISTVMRLTESEDRLSLNPKMWFRAFVYIHDLIPWNYSAIQCTLPLPLCDEQAQHELNRLKDFLGAELCYFYSTLNLPANFEKRDGIRMNVVLVQMRALVNSYASVHEYFEKGEHFQNSLRTLIPDNWIINEDIVGFNIHMAQKIYSESLHFLNSRAPSLDTYIKRVIYTNLPSDQLYDPCLSRQDCRNLKNALLVASSSRLASKLEAYGERLRQREIQNLAQQSRISQIMIRLRRQVQDGNDDEDEDNDTTDIVVNNRADVFYDPSGHAVFNRSYPNIRPNFQHHSLTPRSPSGRIMVSSIHDVLYLNRPDASNFGAYRATVRRSPSGPVPEWSLLSADSATRSYSRTPPVGVNGAAFHRRRSYLIRTVPPLHFNSLAEIELFLQAHPEAMSSSSNSDPLAANSDTPIVEAVVHNGIPVRPARNSHRPGEDPIELDDTQQLHILRNLPYLTFDSIIQLEVFFQRHPEAMLQRTALYYNRNPSASDPYARGIEPTPGGPNVSEEIRAPWAEWSFVRQELPLANLQSSSSSDAAADAADPSQINSSRSGRSGLEVINDEYGSTAIPTGNDHSYSGEVLTFNISSRSHRAPESSSVAANDEREIGLSSNISAVSRDTDSHYSVHADIETPRGFFRRLEPLRLRMNVNEVVLSDESNGLDGIHIFTGRVHSPESSRDSILAPTGSNVSILEHESQTVGIGNDSHESGQSTSSSNRPRIICNHSRSNGSESIPMQIEQTESSIQNLNLPVEINDSGSMNSSIIANVSVSSESTVDAVQFEDSNSNSSAVLNEAMVASYLAVARPVISLPNPIAASPSSLTQSRYNLRKRPDNQTRTLSTSKRGRPPQTFTEASTNEESENNDSQFDNVSNQATVSSQPPSPGSSDSSSGATAGGSGGSRHPRANRINELMGQIRDIATRIDTSRSLQHNTVTLTPAFRYTPPSTGEEQNVSTPARIMRRLRPNRSTSTPSCTVTAPPEPLILPLAVASTSTASPGSPNSPSNDSADGHPAQHATNTIQTVLSDALRRVREIEQLFDRRRSEMYPICPRTGRRMPDSRITAFPNLNRPRPFGSTRPPIRPQLYQGGPSVEPKLEIPPPEGDEVEKLRTGCIDHGPGIMYYLRQIYPEESDGDSESEDEYISMRGNPSQWKRAKRSNLRNRSSSGTNRKDLKPQVSSGLWIASTSGISRQQDQGEGGSSRNVASCSSSKINLNYSDSD